MTHEEIIKAVAEFYNVEPDENGGYNVSDYDFTAGCSLGNGLWLNLASVVDCIEEIMEDLL